MEDLKGGSALPETWLDLELMLKSYKDTKPTLTFKEFKELGVRCRIENEKELLDAAKLLQQFGSLVSVDDGGVDGDGGGMLDASNGDVGGGVMIVGAMKRWV